ncbi:helix-turn-helix transcriptional regulator [Streptomyces sp. NPDC006984]|uniref:helix-turn-helix domain-containing protein n=1 Tax=Streptomyces sp. NPDC006984 TaxID=3155463 RepID=UPI0033D6D318
MDLPTGLGSFLTSRRARVTPRQAGVPVVGRRRVAGLRREEVAELAGVSLVYYTRLEQGRARNPSEAVLAALARVLRLDPAERSHLYDLAQRTGRRTPPPHPAAAREPGTGPADAESAVREEGVRVEGVPGAGVREEVRLLLHAVGAVPAYVLTPAMDVPAANDLARALVGGLSGGPGGGANLARYVFLDAGARELYPHWDDVARQTVGFLRFSAGRHPGDARLASVVAGLSRADESFRRLWAAHEVQEKTHGTKSFRHPVAGRLDLAYETLLLPGDTGLSLVVLTATDPRTEAALHLLGSWTAGHPEQSAGKRRPASASG